MLRRTELLRIVRKAVLRFRNADGELIKSERLKPFYLLFRIRRKRNAVAAVHLFHNLLYFFFYRTVKIVCKIEVAFLIAKTDNLSRKFFPAFSALCPYLRKHRIYSEPSALVDHERKLSLYLSGSD